MWAVQDRLHTSYRIEQKPFKRLFYTPYWTTFELVAIDVKAASVGILDQIVARLR